MKKIMLNITISATALLVSLMILEIVLRVFYSVPRHLEYPYRKSSIEGLSYELNPGYDGSRLHQRGTTARLIKINKLGLRDSDISLQKKQGTRRILAIGDSTTFGPGVILDETYPNQLERMLAERDERLEIINAGTPGYNTGQEKNWFMTYGLNLSPDILLIGYFLNDANPSSDWVWDNSITGIRLNSYYEFVGDDDWREYAKSPMDYKEVLKNKRYGKSNNFMSTFYTHRFFSPKISFVTDRLAARLKIPKKDSIVEGAANYTSLTICDRAKGLAQAFVREDRGWGTRKLDLLQLSTKAREEQIPSLVLIFPVPCQLESQDEDILLPQKVIGAYAQSHSLPVLDLLPIFKASGYELSDLFLDDFGHLTGLGNRLVAETVLKELESQCFIGEEDPRC